MADFVDRAGGLRRTVEAALAALFTPDGLVTDAGIPPELAGAMRYALLGGGKRVRPVLCLAACQAVCGDPAPALPAALAIEVLHNYTLVHDDLPCMDDDLLRRGRPTVHAKFGYGQAVLVGDALQAAAFRLAIMAPSPDCARALALAAGPSGVVGGQWVDVTAAPPHDGARIAYVHEHKTGDLMACACETGAMSGGADAAAVSAARLFGLRLGEAFQIVDDLLDAGDPAKAGELSILRVASPGEAAAAAKAKTGEALDALAAVEAAGPGTPASASAAALMRDLALAQLSRTV